jgi:hypothetical protein
MSSVDLLFQYYSASANSTLTTGDLLYTSPAGGSSMVTALYAAASGGGTSNLYRIHHCGPEETPSTANVLIYATSTTKAQTNYFTQKIVMRPGDRLFCALHSGNAISLTGYGILPPETSRTVSELRGDIGMINPAEVSQRTIQSLNRAAEIDSLNLNRLPTQRGY